MWAFLLYIRHSSLSRTFFISYQNFSFDVVAVLKQQLYYFNTSISFCQEVFSTSFSNILVFCADSSAATQLEYHKRVILSSTFFFRSVLFSFLWLVCDALSLSAWIEYTFFDTKSTHISRIFRVLSIWIVNQRYYRRNMCNIVIYRIFTRIFSNF